MLPSHTLGDIYKNIFKYQGRTTPSNLMEFFTRLFDNTMSYEEIIETYSKSTLS